MVAVPLTQGKVAVIDDVDLPLVAGQPWRTLKGRAYTETTVPVWYAVRSECTDGRRSCVLLHRVILGLGPGDPDVDHVNGDGLNNTRTNLRIATASQNVANQRGHARRKSRYKGVFWSKDARYRAGGQWLSRLSVHGIQHTRYSKTEIEAAEKYNALALRHFGQFARLNLGTS